MKRITASVLACLMILACTCGTAGAAFDAGTKDTSLDAGLDESAVLRSSLYISRYYAYLEPGNSSGQLKISYSVFSGRQTTAIGVSQIKIYQSNGTLVTTIYGSAYNGLLRTDGSQVHNGVYYYNAIPGATYYAVVVVYAADDYGNDCRIVTTDTIATP